MWKCHFSFCLAEWRCYCLQFGEFYQRTDDEAAKGGIGIRVGVGVAVGFLAVGGELIFPFGAEFGSI